MLAQRRRAAANARRYGATGAAGYTRTSGYYGRFASAGTESKFLDTARAAAVPATTGTIMNNTLVTIPQNTTESGRIGRKVMLTKLFMQGHILIPTTATNSETSDIVRLILYQDKQCNGAAATVTDILESADILSYRNLANSGRFIVLADKKWVISCSTGSGNGTTDSYTEAYKAFKINKMLKVPLEYDSTTGAITELRSNNIGVLAITETGVASLQYNVRVRYNE
jgi:hypothetical protein